MKIKLSIMLACAAAMTLSACDLARRGVDRELHYPGGLRGSVTDRVFYFDASASKELQLYRDALTIALFSRVATANITDGKEADAFVSLLEGALRELSYMGGHLYTVDGKKPCAPNLTGADCRAYSAVFESDLPILENKILTVAFHSMPKEQAAALYSSAKRIDPLSTARAFFKLGARSVLSFHRGAAVHRSGIELFAGAVANSQGVTDEKRVRTVIDAVCYLNRMDPKAASQCGQQARLAAKPERNSFADLKTYRAALAEVTIAKEGYQPIIDMIRTSCLLLPINADTDTGAATGTPADIVGERKTRCKNLKFEPARRLDTL